MMKTCECPVPDLLQGRNCFDCRKCGGLSLIAIDGFTFDGAECLFNEDDDDGSQPKDVPSQAPTKKGTSKITMTKTLTKKIPSENKKTKARKSASTKTKKTTSKKEAIPDKPASPSSHAPLRKGRNWFCFVFKDSCWEGVPNWLYYYLYHTKDKNVKSVECKMWKEAKGNDLYPCLLMSLNSSSINDLFNAKKHVIPFKIHQSKEPPINIFDMEVPKSSTEEMLAKFESLQKQALPMDKIILKGRGCCDAMVVVDDPGTGERKHRVVVFRNKRWYENHSNVYTLKTLCFLKEEKNIGRRLINDEKKPDVYKFDTFEAGVREVDGKVSILNVFYDKDGNYCLEEKEGNGKHVVVVKDEANIFIRK